MPLNIQNLENLIAAINVVVHDVEHPWQIKKQQILDVVKNNATEMSFEEFISWFEEEEED